MKKIFNLFIISTVFLFSLCSCSSKVDPEPTPDPDPSPVIKEGEALTYAKEIAKVSSMSYEEILSSSSLSGEEEMTGSLLLKVLYNSFSDLKEAEGYNARIIDHSDDLVLDNLSEEEKKEYNFFYDRGLLGENNDGFSYLDEDTFEIKVDLSKKVSLDVLTLTLRRIAAYKQDNLKNDFYAYVNKEDLNSIDTVYMAIADTTKEKENINNLIVNMPSGDKNKILIDNFNSTLFDEDARKDNIGGIKDILLKIHNAYSFDDLSNVLEEIYDESRFVPFFESTSFDSVNPSENEFNLIFTLNDPFSIDTHNDYKDTSIYKNLTKLYSVLGVNYDPYNAVKEYIEIGNTLGKYKKENKLRGEKTKFNNDLYLNKFNLREVFKSSGLNADYVYIANQDYLVKMNEELSKSLNASKIYILNRFIKEYNLCFDETNRINLGYPYKDSAFEYGDAYYSNYLNYVANEVTSFFSKTDSYSGIYKSIKTCLDNVREGAREIFEKNTWLTASDKEKIIEKLENIDYLIMAGEDSNSEYYPLHEYKNVKDGGTMFYNLSLFNKTDFDTKGSAAGKKTDAFFKAYTSPLTLNAYNVPDINHICITPGYILSFKDFENMSQEEIYIRIGYVLGHEFMHSFDKNGFPYDKDGNYNPDWISKEAQDTFYKKNEEVAEFYSSFEEFPFQKMNGEIKCMEGLADILGFKASLNAAKKLANFDYDAFYKNFARIHLTVASKFIYISGFISDPHPICQGRCNTVLMNIPEFLEFYDISEDNLMYLSSDKMVSVY